MPTTHLTRKELEAGLDMIMRAPKDEGVVQMIVRRPKVGGRELVEEVDLDAATGMAGDSWITRAMQLNPSGDPDRDNQITIVNARAISHVAQERERWPLAGDQLYIDLDVSQDNLPAGTLLAIGSAIIEITSAPHTGCRKFAARFGPDAVEFVNSPIGLDLRLRGVNACVFQSGTIRVGDVATKLASD
jgi:MOSC domain-containing protein YiiM